MPGGGWRRCGEKAWLEAEAYFYFPIRWQCGRDEHMILLSASNKLRKAFHMPPPEPTPSPPGADWYRFWRVDAKAYKGFGEVMLFTNHETLYTFVADSSTFRSASDLIKWFLARYFATFGKKLYPDGQFNEELAFHSGADKSVIGVMNSHFQNVNYLIPRKPRAELEAWLNQQLILTRKFIPEQEVQKRLNSGFSRA
jgi:hypothetical protein